MEIPKKLYKYEAFNELSLRNLKRQSIYFGNPKGFNDPYDCAITAEIQELSEGDMNIILSNYINDNLNSDHSRTEFEQAQKFSPEIIRQHLKEKISKDREEYVSKIGISCFSEINDNLLMWAHYGGKYKGFCLEFDTSDEPFSKVLEVKYSEFIPQIDSRRLIIEDDGQQFLDLFLIKSKSWEYEKEWRILHQGTGTLYTYQAQSLTGIYFGPEMEEECFEIIALILGGQNEHVKLYKGSISKTVFKVEFEQVNYMPYLEAKKHGLR